MAVVVADNPTPKIGDLVTDQEGAFYLVEGVSVEQACACEDAPLFWVARLKRLTRTGAKLRGGSKAAARVLVENLDEAMARQNFRPIRWS